MIALFFYISISAQPSNLGNPPRTAQLGGMTMFIASTKLLVVHRPKEGQYLRKYLFYLFAAGNCVLMLAMYRAGKYREQCFPSWAAWIECTLITETVLFLQQAVKTRVAKKGRVKED